MEVSHETRELPKISVSTEDIASLASVEDIEACLDKVETLHVILNNRARNLKYEHSSFEEEKKQYFINKNNPPEEIEILFRNLIKMMIAEERFVSNYTFLSAKDLLVQLSRIVTLDECEVETSQFNSVRVSLSHGIIWSVHHPNDIWPYIKVRYFGPVQEDGTFAKARSFFTPKSLIEQTVKDYERFACTAKQS